MLADKKTRMRRMSTLDDLFRSGKLHADAYTNRKMMVAAEVWHHFAVIVAQEAGPQAAGYSERVSTSLTRMDVDKFLSNLVDAKKRAAQYRKLTSAGARQILDSVIVEDLSIADAAKKLRGNAGKTATDDIRSRFRQALEDFAQLTQVLGT